MCVWVCVSIYLFDTILRSPIRWPEDFVTRLIVRKCLNLQFLYWITVPAFSVNNLDWTVFCYICNYIAKYNTEDYHFSNALNWRKWIDNLHNQHLMWDVGFFKRWLCLSGRCLKEALSERNKNSEAIKSECKQIPCTKPICVHILFI